MMLLFLSGCWGSRELNDLSIATAIGIDYHKNGYTVTTQIVDPAVLSPQQSTPNTTAINTYSATGKTIFEALRKITKDSPRKIYVGHVQIVVFGEKLAKHGIKKTLDYLIRNNEMRPNFYLMIAKDTTAAHILKVITPLDKLPADKIFRSVKLSQKQWGSTTEVQLDNLIMMLMKKGDNPVLNSIILDNDSPQGSTLKNMQDSDIPVRLMLGPLGVFKNGKLVGYLNEKESIGWNYIEGNINSTVITVPCQDGHLSVEVTQSKSNMEAKVVNGNPKVTVHVDIKGNIGDVECHISFTNKNNVKQVEKLVGSQIQKQIMTSVNVVQKKFQSDIFGFGEAIHRENPDYWRLNKNDWSPQFAKLSVNVDVNFHLKGLGSVVDSFQ